MDQQQPQPPIQSSVPQKNKLPFLILILAVVSAYLFFILLRAPAKNTTTVQGNEVTPTLAVPDVTTVGTVSLKEKTPGSTYKVGAPVRVVVVGNSNGNDVVGYDLLVQYDVKNFTVGATTSLQQGFTLFKRMSNGVVSLTGIKNPSNTQVSAWDNTSVAEIELLPKQTGTQTVSIISQKGKEKTQYVDSQSAVYRPQVGAITVEIE